MATRISHALGLFIILAVTPQSCTASYGSFKKSLPYSRNSHFVRLPGYVVGGAMVIPGIVIGMTLFCPVAALKLMMEKTPIYSFSECFGAGVVGGFYSGTAIGGFPFYALEEVFWDLPQKAISSSGMFDHPKTGTILKGHIVWDEE